MLFKDCERTDGQTDDDDADDDDDDDDGEWSQYLTLSLRLRWAKNGDFKQLIFQLILHHTHSSNMGKILWAFMYWLTYFSTSHPYPSRNTVPRVDGGELCSAELTRVGLEFESRTAHIVVFLARHFSCL